MKIWVVSGTAVLPKHCKKRPGGVPILTVVGLQVLVQLVPLILQHIAEVGRDFARRLLDVRVQLAKIVGQTDQLIERTDLKSSQESVRTDWTQRGRQ